MAGQTITEYRSSSGAVLQLSSPKAKVKRPDWKISVVGSVLLLALAVAAWKLWPSRPQPTAPPAKLVRFIASDDFALMRPDEKQPYVDAIQKVGMRDLFRAANDAKLTDDERMNGMENFMMARWNKSLNEYFNVPLKDRDAYLGKMI